MSTTQTTPVTTAGPRLRPLATARPWTADAIAVALLSGMLVVLAAVTWRKWGVPEIDAGAELTTADRVARGAVAYRDVRYYYGPLGLYGLAATFKVLGASFTTAYLFGFAQTIGILGATYALARRWVTPAYATATTAVTMAIGFSGTAFNFVLPHTNSATLGLLFTLLTVLALTHRRHVTAGVLLGLVALTRPEFAGAAWGGVLAYGAVTWRVADRRTALRETAQVAVGAILVPLLVYGAFAATVGESKLLWQNLWPRDFIRIAGFRTQADWMPVSLPALLALAVRGALYAGALGAVLRGTEVWVDGTRRGWRRVAATAAPAVVAAAAALVLDGILRALGLLGVQRRAIEQELHHLMLPMSWLPGLGVAAVLVSLWCLRRRAPSPLGGRWPADAALVVVAALLGLRAYNMFTTEGSYAPYYAAPLVVILGIVHQRLALAHPRTRSASLAFLSLAAAGLAVYAISALYADNTTTVSSPRGSFVTTARAAGPLQAAIRAVDRDSPAGAAILAGPADGGLYFMTDRRPGLYEVMLLPGLLATTADQRRAIDELRRARVDVAVIGQRDFSVWGWPRFGVDYNKLLGDWLRTHSTAVAHFGSTRDVAGGTVPSAGFEVRRLRAGSTSR